MSITQIRQGTYAVTCGDKTLVVHRAQVRLKRTGRARRWAHILEGWLKVGVTRFAAVLRLATPVEVRAFLDYLGYAWSGVQAALEHLGEIMGPQHALALCTEIEWRAGVVG